jgi:hypothetical protein
MSVVCYCDSCQEGAREIEALTNAPPVLGSDGGTAYIAYRKDRVAYSKGFELLKGYKIDEKSATSRVVANAAIPTDVPSSAMYPGGFAWKLLTSKLSMMFGR